MSHVITRMAAASALTMAFSVHAAPVYLIDATTNGLAPDAAFTNVAFSLTYEDFNFDRLFSLNELLAFTGVFDANGNYFDTLLGVPTIPGITGNGINFRFGDSMGLLPNFIAAASTFTAFTTRVDGSSVVPEPGVLALCMTGLAALVFTRRKATGNSSLN